MINTHANIIELPIDNGHTEFTIFYMFDFHLGEAGKVLGIGTDIIDVDRVKDACENHKDRFIQRIFTSAEIEYCQKKEILTPIMPPGLQQKKQLAKLLQPVLVNTWTGLLSKSVKGVVKSLLFI